MQDLSKTLSYLLPAAAPAALEYFQDGRLDLSTAGVGAAGALAGVLVGNQIGAVGGFLKIESQTTSRIVTGALAGVGAGAALVFVGGKDMMAVAPVVGVTAVASIASGYIADAINAKKQ